MTTCSPGITDHVAMDEDEGDDEMIERDEQRDSFEVSPISPVGTLSLSLSLSLSLLRAT